jgi:DNA-binding MarR family transcriptional regulator
MEAAGLITRTRGSADRRLVSTQLTQAGRALVDSLDAPSTTEHRDRLGHLSADQLRTLIDLLTEVRRTG